MMARLLSMMGRSIMHCLILLERDGVDANIAYLVSSGWIAFLLGLFVFWKLLCKVNFFKLALDFELLAHRVVQQVLEGQMNESP